MPSFYIKSEWGAHLNGIIFFTFIHEFLNHLISSSGMFLVHSFCGAEADRLLDQIVQYAVYYI